MPTDDGDVSFPVTDEERNLFDNQSLVTDWPDEGKEQAIDRISQGLLVNSLVIFDIDIDNRFDEPVLLYRLAHSKHVRILVVRQTYLFICVCEIYLILLEFFGGICSILRRSHVGLCESIKIA